MVFRRLRPIRSPVMPLKKVIELVILKKIQLNLTRELIKNKKGEDSAAASP